MKLVVEAEGTPKELSRTNEINIESTIHKKWKGFCFYTPPPLPRNPAQERQTSSFNSTPMQLCTEQTSNQKHKNYSQQQPLPSQQNVTQEEEEQQQQQKQKEEEEKESIDTIIENEYSDEMSFLIKKIDLSEDDDDYNNDGSKGFMPYIY